MCVSCLSTAEAWALNLAAAAAAASGVRDRRRDRAAGITVHQRRALTWNANASFVAGLGLDPLMVLGPYPTMPDIPGPEIPRPGPGEAMPVPVPAGARG